MCYEPATEVLLIEVDQLTYTGKTYSVTLIQGEFVLNDRTGPEGTYDSFEELVEDHPICEEAIEFFFGSDD